MKLKKTRETKLECKRISVLLEVLVFRNHEKLKIFFYPLNSCLICYLEKVKISLLLKIFLIAVKRNFKPNGIGRT